jgi:predicted ATPase
LLLEEPELNLHPEVVHYLPQMFARMQRRASRQVIISTHSADLLRDEGIGLDEVLLLKPQDEGTAVEVAKNIQDAETLVQGGVPLPDVILPATRSPKARQLADFGE